jgi:hypothetical protein
MARKKLIKAFVAGMAFPAIFLPLAYTLLFYMEHHSLQQHPLQFIPLYLPIVWGIANAVFIELHDDSNKSNVNSGLWVTGVILGFLVAVFGVFVINIPIMIFGDMHGFEFAPLVILPIIYGLLFRYVVKWLNKLLAV